MGARPQVEGLAIDRRGHLCCCNRMEGAMDKERCCVFTGLMGKLSVGSEGQECLSREVLKGKLRRV